MNAKISKPRSTWQQRCLNNCFHPNLFFFHFNVELAKILAVPENWRDF